MGGDRKENTEKIFFFYYGRVNFPLFIVQKNKDKD